MISSRLRVGLLLMLFGLVFASENTAAAGERKGAKTSKDGSKQEPIFFPPAPEQPRIQYLVSFSKDADLGGGPGKFARFLVGKEPPKTAIVKPWGLAFHKGNLFICDTSARAVLNFDLRKKQMSLVSTERQAQFKSPINITLDEEGNRYVADSARGEVLILDGNDRFLGAVGLTNMRPTGVAVSGSRLYVADIAGRAVRVFDKVSHEPLFKIPREESATNQLIAPTAVALDRQGRIYVSEMTMGRVQVFDSEGQPVRTIGQIGDRPGEFVRPKGLALDRENRLYVVDAATAVVQMFDDQGRLLMYFGEPDSGMAALSLPAGIAIDYETTELFQKYAAPGFKLEHLVFVTSQFGDRKVTVYGFGNKE